MRNRKSIRILNCKNCKKMIKIPNTTAKYYNKLKKNDGTELKIYCPHCNERII